MSKHRDLATIVYANTLGRTSSARIWRAVVVAGAMLGTPACSKEKPASTTPPENMAGPTAKPDTKPDPALATPTNPDPAPTPSADPCAGAAATEPPKQAVEPAPDPAPDPAAADTTKKGKRPRSNNNDKPRGRGFVLA